MLHHNMRTLTTYCLYNDVTNNKPNSHGIDYFKVISGGIHTFLHTFGSLMALVEASMQAIKISK